MKRRTCRILFCVVLALMGINHPRLLAVPPEIHLAAMPERVTLNKVYSYPEEMQVDTSETSGSVRAFLKQFDDRISRLMVEKTGNTRRETHRLVNGSSIEFWSMGKVRFWEFSEAETYIHVHSPEMGETDEGVVPDFDEVAWVSLDTYVGEKSINGVKCAVYEHDGQTAWIETKTRLPLRFKSETVAIEYNFKAGPSTDLKMPREYEKRWREVVNSWTGRN